jgi:hypothetical protein
MKRFVEPATRQLSAQFNHTIYIVHLTHIMSTPMMENFLIFDYNSRREKYLKLFAPWLFDGDFDDTASRLRPVKHPVALQRRMAKPGQAIF